MQVRDCDRLSMPVTTGGQKIQLETQPRGAEYARLVSEVSEMPGRLV